MAEIKNKNDNKTNFSVSRVKTLKELYSDEYSTGRRYNRNNRANTGKDISSAAALRKQLELALQDNGTVVELSQSLYSINPIYASVIDYLADMYLWRYKITPHKVYTKSKAKTKKQLKDEDFQLIYNLMLEVVDGLHIETKFPALLSKLFIDGSVYFTTFCDEANINIDTLLLPSKYVRKIGETQFGTAIIQFDFGYFADLGLNTSDLKEYLKSFPKEFERGYKIYLKDTQKNRWQTLDPHFSSGLMLNDHAVPTYLYLYGAILDYEQYQDNELERNDNLLKYLVVHTMPHYEDKLIFEVDEVQAIHQSLRRVVDKGEKARLVTTYGDVHVENLGKNDKSENEVLSKAFKSIFNNAGFNSGIFTSETVEALKMSLVRDKAKVWKFIQQLLSFYTIAINNWFDFKEYQTDIAILPISTYTYNDDMEIYRENATLGVGKIDYIVASGIKQKDIADQLHLEAFLKLDEIVPMQTSYTQTAEDRSMNDITDKDSKKSKSLKEESDNEPDDSNEVDEKEKDEDAKESK